MCVIPNFRKLLASYRFTRENAFLKLLDVFLKLERALKKHFPLQMSSLEIAYKSFVITYKKTCSNLKLLLAKIHYF